MQIDAVGPTRRMPRLTEPHSDRLCDSDKTVPVRHRVWRTGRWGQDGQLPEDPPPPTSQKSLNPYCGIR